MNDESIKKLLMSSKVVAVVGISNKPERASYGVSKYLIEHNYEIYGVNPNAEGVHNRPSFKSLKEVPKAIDIVDVFRKPEAVPEIVEEAIQIGVKTIWLQEGVHHKEAEEKAIRAGIQVVSNRCILKEHRRLIR